MKSKVRRFKESVVAVGFLAGIWFIYNHYVLANFTNGSNLVADESKRNTIMLIIFIITTIVFLISSYALINYIHRWLNKRSASTVISNLAYDLCRLYLDDDFISYCNKFGVIVNHSSISITPEIMSKCSLHSLARLVSAVCNKNATSSFDFNKIFYSLADLIIDTWSVDDVDAFVHYIYLDNIVLGEHIKYAVDRQKVSREALEFNQGVENRLAELDKLHEEKSLATIARLNSQFQYSDYLISGGSAFRSWLKKKLTFKRFSKLAIIK